MSEYARTIIRDLGVAIHIPGVMALVSIPVGLVSGEGAMVAAFAVCAVASFVPGQILYRLFRKADAMQVRHAMDTALLAWIAISIIAALPFFLGALWSDGGGQNTTFAAFADPWNALFESVSGITSTGLSVTARPEDLPFSLLWWRSLSQWIGGVGVIVLMLAVFHPSEDAPRLFLAEAHEQKIVPSLVETVRTTWWIYLLVTLVALLALRLVGMNWWQATNYAMTGIATGGFGVTNGNIGDFGLGPRLVLMVAVIIGAISFAYQYRLLTKRQFSILWMKAESRLFLALLLIGSVVVGLEAWWFSGKVDWLESSLHWISALCTAGFQTTDFGDWSVTARLILVAGMIAGGMAGSTAGGLKLNRVHLLARGAFLRIDRIVRQPWRLTEHKELGDKSEAIRERHLLEAASLLALIWIVCLIVGAIVLLHVVGQASFDTVLFEAASALSNVGLSTGLTGPELPWAGKAALIAMMWMGRLEIIPVLVVVASVSRRIAHNSSNRTRPRQ